MTASIVSHIKENKRIYTHPYTIISLALWSLILATHAFLVFRLVHEIYDDFISKALEAS